MRTATVEDVPHLVDFNRRLAEETEGKRLDVSRLEAGVRAMFADARRGRYFVVERQQRIVGQLMHTWEWSDWRNGDLWWLQSVYVEPEARRGGAFRALFEHVCGLAAADAGVVGLRLYVEQDNHRARNAYAKLGLRDAGYRVMERMFAAADGPG